MAEPDSLQAISSTSPKTSPLDFKKKFWWNMMTVGGFTFLSRIFGFLREIIIAAVIGAGAESDAYVAVIKLPQFFRRTFAEGALNNSFIPIFAEVYETEGPKKAKQLFHCVLIILVMTLMTLVLAFEWNAPWICSKLYPGWVGDSARFERVVFLSRIAFPSLIFFSLFALFGGVLNSLNKFTAWGAAPALGNASIVLIFLALLPLNLVPERVMTSAVLASTVIQWLCVYIPARRAGFGIGIGFSPKIRVFLAKFLPAAAISSTNQINVFIGLCIASFLPKGSLSLIHFADRLFNLPYTIIAITLSTVILPMLSRQIHADDVEGTAHTKRFIFHTACLTTLPVVVVLLTMAEPLLSFCYERGKFGPEQVHYSAMALRIYALALPGYVMHKILNTMFFAHKDTSTPMKGTIISVIIDIIACIIFVALFGGYGIPLGTTLAAWAAVAVLIPLSAKKWNFHIIDRSFLVKTLVASATMAAVLVLSGSLQARGFITIVILLLKGAATFIACALILGLWTWRNLTAWIKNKWMTRIRT